MSLRLDRVGFAQGPDMLIHDISPTLALVGVRLTKPGLPVMNVDVTLLTTWSAMPMPKRAQAMRTDGKRGADNRAPDGAGL